MGNSRLQHVVQENNSIKFELALALFLLSMKKEKITFLKLYTIGIQRGLAIQSLAHCIYGSSRRLSKKSCT